MNSQQRNKRFEKAQTGVIFKVPFFAPGVARLPVVWDTSIETACTDGKAVHWSPEFFDGLTDSQLVTVLCHETAHCLLGHLWRAPDGVDWDKWNQACDHAVNLMLKEFSQTVTAKGLADPFPFPEPADAYCADPAYKGLAEEVIYKRMPKVPPGGNNGGGSASGKGKGASKPQPGSMPSFGQMAQPQAGDPEAKSNKADWDGTLIQSAKIAKSQGTLSAGMEGLIEGLVSPRLPWWELLRSYLREQCSDDWNWQEPAMEYEGSGFVLPSLKSEKCGAVVFATDSSGSTWAVPDLLAAFQSEKQNALDTLRPSKLVDIHCDSAIHDVREYVAGDVIDRKLKGGGGTSFVPVFEHIEAMKDPVKVVVYLTDLEGTFPDVEPTVPVIWVTWTKDQQAPFGLTVYAGD